MGLIGLIGGGSFGKWGLIGGMGSVFDTCRLRGVVLPSKLRNAGVR